MSEDKSAGGFIPKLKLHNTLSGEKEEFAPLNPPHVGFYVCGPTVYNDPHIGNSRPAIIFDVLRRYLTYLGYKVRFVRNITDVGHLLGDANEGEDRISKQAKLLQIEPMEVVHKYTHIYHQMMDALNVIRPSIEPTATGHIPEQIEAVQKILEAGLAYESDGSVYFDVRKYNENANYGELSGRIIEDLLENTRELDGQQEKRFSADFAIWKKASPEHLMRWNSPWGEGFPGWHLECTVMSTKYLGETFDIHGGGMDLMFPHHECEIAQSRAINGQTPVKYWLHNNMLTINGSKMSKSAGNFITLRQLFSGDHPTLEQAYTPMTIRFFVLQAHYRSTIDFSNEALQAAHKGYKRLINSLTILNKLQYPENPSTEPNAKMEKQVSGFCDNAFRGMNDDVNTAKVLGQLSNMVKKINTFFLNPGEMEKISRETFDYLANTYRTFVTDILGLVEEPVEDAQALIEGLLEVYADAKAKKDYDTVDRIRAYFQSSGLIIKDLKNGIDWAYQE